METVTGIIWLLTATVWFIASNISDMVSIKIMYTLCGVLCLSTGLFYLL